MPITLRLPYLVAQSLECRPVPETRNGLSDQYRYIPVSHFVFTIPLYTVNTAIPRGPLPSAIESCDCSPRCSESATLVEQLRRVIAFSARSRSTMCYRFPISVTSCGLASLNDIGRAAGAYGVTLSGSGPTLSRLLLRILQTA
jgi:homoserine kinase